MLLLMLSGVTAMSLKLSRPGANTGKTLIISYALCMIVLIYGYVVVVLAIQFNINIR